MPSVQHCLCVLFDRAPELEAVATALDRWDLAGRRPPAGGRDGWMASGPGLAFWLRSGVPVLVDVLDRPWPDVADEGADPEPLQAAWRAGHFGPCSFPGALARAREHSWVWPAAARARHGAVVRLRALAETATDPDGPASDPVYQMTALTEMAGALLELPGAGALFTPGGEALRGREQVSAALQRKAALEPPPIELWLNLRAFDAGWSGGERWVIVDVVGMSQLGLPDQEAFFADGREQPEVAALMLRAACHCLLAGQTIRKGTTARDTSGRRWRASFARSIAEPPRPVVRWISVEGAGTAEALADLGAPEGEGDPTGPDESAAP